MSVSELSTSAQNYVKAIWSLQEWSDSPVTPTSLAAKTGVKLSTASDAVRKLTEQGLIEHAPYGSVTLTSTGTAHALQMVRRHRLIETFLVRVLGYGWDQVHDEAEHLEHAVSDFMIERIDEHLGHPTHDPHGDAIPDAGGEVIRTTAIRLTSLEPGADAQIARISDADPALLAYLAELGIGVGSIVRTEPGAPFSDALNVTIDGAPSAVSLGRSATDSVWVTVA